MENPASGNTSAWVAAGVLAAMWGAEWAAPLVMRGPGRMGHGARNVAVGASAAAVRVFGLTGVLAYLTTAAQRDGAGFLRPLDGTVGAGVLAFLILDLWNYLFHVMCHKFPLLWRFHTVHHTDTEPDATTALRFHFGEVAAVGVGYLIVLPLAGITMPQFLFYEAVLIAASIFHHANLRLPERLDRALRWVIVTPGMHVVHHSAWVGQTDSNYSAVLSLWDHLFGTTRDGDPATMVYGLDGYSEGEHSTVGGLLLMPLGGVKSEPGRPPEGVVVKRAAGREADAAGTLAA